MEVEVEVEWEKRSEHGRTDTELIASELTSCRPCWSAVASVMTSRPVEVDATIW